MPGFARFFAAFAAAPFIGAAAMAARPDSAPAKAAESLMFAGRQNALRVDALYSVDPYADNIFLFGLAYSQPNSFFRLPGRRSLHAMYFTGRTKGTAPPAVLRSQGISPDKNISVWAFGISQDVVFASLGGWNFGAGIGPFVKERKNDFMGSKFMVGERLFAGRMWGAFGLEINAQHYSNGHLTPINRGINTVGLGATYAF